jgi:SAM-dependent methyltransferase
MREKRASSFLSEENSSRLLVMPNQGGGKPKAEIPVAAMVRHCFHLLRQRIEPLAMPYGLVVGCGKGDEVVYLRRGFRGAPVVGLDVEMKFSSLARAEAALLVADAGCLPFPAEAFDFVAAFHSLEHVGDPRRALAEVRRVLRPGAWFYVGVPNRARLVGYLGSFDATAWQKLAWNVQDYAARLRGRFRNEFGAHAGFEGKELVSLLGEFFGQVQLVTEEFLRFKYSGRLPGRVLNFLLGPRVLHRTAPAHYALCRKSVGGRL